MWRWHRCALSPQLSRDYQFLGIDQARFRERNSNWRTRSWCIRGACSVSFFTIPDPNVVFMTMHAAALRLFLAECTATSLKKEVELKGSLASALQVRHKIRDTDLGKLFDLADKAPPDTYRRHYYVYTLQLFSGSAYSTFDSIVSASAGTLANVLVKPHWDPLKTHSLGSIYDQEPMNLFPGWSLTNARNNQMMLDPHLLMLHSDGGISTDLNGKVSSKATSRTIGMQVSEALRSEDEQVTEDRLKGGTLPGLQQTYSPYSNKLKKSEPQMLKTLGKLSGDESRAYDNTKAIKKFVKILEEMRKTTIAGDAHYNLLSGSLLNQKLTSSALLSAQKYWTHHRSTAEREIDALIKELRTKDAQEHAMTLRHHTPR